MLNWKNLSVLLKSPALQGIVINQSLSRTRKKKKTSQKGALMLILFLLLKRGLAQGLESAKESNLST